MAMLTDEATALLMEAVSAMSSGSHFRWGRNIGQATSPSLLRRAESLAVRYVMSWHSSLKESERKRKRLNGCDLIGAVCVDCHPAVNQT
jgi:hypothetical protein